MHIKDKIIKKLDKIIELAFYVLIAAVTFSTAFVEIATTVIIISWIAKKIILKDSTFPNNLFFIFFIFFIIWNILSVFNSEYLYESIRGLIKIIEYGLLLLITIDVVKSKDFLKKAIYCLIIWSLIIAFNGIIQGILGFDLIRLRAIDTLDYLHRISSSFHQSNNFGAYLVIIIPIYLSFVFFKKIDLRIRVYFLFGLIPLAYCIIKTYSRGTWLSLYIAILILTLLKSKKLLVVFIILTIILYLFLPLQIKERAADLLNFKAGTSSWERLKLWSGTITMIKKHPFLGFGVNTYTKNFSFFKPTDYPDVIYTHNCYLQMAAEIGLIGLGLFLTFAILAFGYIASCLKVLPSGWMYSTATGLFAGEIGFLIHSSVDTHLYSVNLAVMFYLLLGFCIALCTYAKDNPA